MKKIFILSLLFLMSVSFASSAAWQPTSAVYENNNFSISSQDSFGMDIFFSSNGSMLYALGIGNMRLFQYTVSDPWNVSSAAYASKYIDLYPLLEDMHGLFFKPDGTEIYIVGDVNDIVAQYTLSTAWDISTAGTPKTISISGSPVGLHFKPDGTKMYIADYDTDAITSYSLTTAWNVSTATADGDSIDITAQESQLNDVYFNPTGTKMYASGTAEDGIFQYTLSTPWNVSTAVYDAVFFSFANENTAPRDIIFNDDGTKIYTIGGDEVIYQYELSTSTILSEATDNSGAINTQANWFYNQFNVSDFGVSDEYSFFNIENISIYIESLESIGNATITVADGLFPNGTVLGVSDILNDSEMAVGYNNFVFSNLILEKDKQYNFLFNYTNSTASLEIGMAYSVGGVNHFAYYTDNETFNLPHEDSAQYIIYGEPTNPACGSTITESITLVGNMTCHNQYALIIGANDVEIDGNGYTISFGNDTVSSYGIYQNLFNNSYIHNVTFAINPDVQTTSQNYAIYNAVANHNRFEDIIFTNGSYGYTTFASIISSGNISMDNLDIDVAYTGISISGTSETSDISISNSIISSADNEGIIADSSSSAMENWINNLIFTNVTTNAGDFDFGLQLEGVKNSEFINSSFSGYAGFFSDDYGTTNITFINSIFSGENVDVNFGYDTSQQANIVNNVFLNCTYDTENVDTGKELTRKWYADIQVNDTSGFLEGANVTIYNNDSEPIVSLLTDSSGSIPIQNLTEYMNIAGALSYYNNYTINISKDGYTSNYSFYNLTDLQNINLDVVLDSGGEADITPPTFTTIPADDTISYGTDWTGVDFDATDETGFDSYSINDTRFTINSTGFLNEVSTLGAGIYSINVTINDTSNNINSTAYTLTVDKNSTYVLGISGTTPITYGTITDVAGSGCPSQLSCSLDISNAIYGVDLSPITFNYSTAGNENYTASSITKEITINQDTTSCQVLFNETSPIDYLNSFLVYSDCSSDFVLKRNGTIISNNSLQNLGAGSYNFTVERTDSINYSNIYDEASFIINKISPAGSLTGTSPISVGTAGDVEGTETNAGDSDVLYKLYRDGVEVSNPDTEVLGIGTYNYIYNSTEGENYTAVASLDTFELIVQDITSPYFTSIPENASIDYLESLGVDFDATDAAEFDTFSVNDTRFTINSTGWLSNNTILGAGNYEINITINDSSNNLNSTIYLVAVNTINPDASITNTTSWDVSYGTETTFGISETNTGDSDVTYLLFRNGTSVGSGETVTLAAGTYYYILNTTGGANYSSNSSLDNKTLTISKDSGSCQVLFNESSSLDYTKAFLVYTDCNSDFTLYKNGTIISNNSIQELAAGSYNFTVVRTDNENYTNIYDEEEFIINKLNSQVYTYLNGSRENFPVEVNNFVLLNSTMITGDIGATINLYINGTLNQTGVSPLNVSYNFTTEGLFNITTTYEETENYTASYETWYVGVSYGDITDPVVIINSPVSGTTYTAATNVLINATITDDFSVDKCFYNLTSASYSSLNQELVNCSNKTVYLSLEESYTLIIWANDTSGNSASNTSLFTIDIPAAGGGGGGSSSTFVPEEDEDVINETNATDENMTLKESYEEIKDSIGELYESSIHRKLTKELDVFGLIIYGWMIAIVIWILTGILLHFFFLKKVTGGIFWSAMAGLLLAFLFLLFI